MVSVISGVFAWLLLPHLARAAFVDTGWIDARSFEGNVVDECGTLVGGIRGRTGLSFQIFKLNLPEGHYSIDILAGYGYYFGDPQEPQINETMRVRTSADAKDIPDLNGSGGGRNGRDNCDAIVANRAVYTNITGSLIHYAGGPLIFEGRDANSQSITIARVRVYGQSEPVVKPPTVITKPAVVTS